MRTPSAAAACATARGSWRGPPASRREYGVLASQKPKAVSLEGVSMWVPAGFQAELGQSHTGSCIWVVALGHDMHGGHAV